LGHHNKEGIASRKRSRSNKRGKRFWLGKKVLGEREVGEPSSRKGLLVKDTGKGNPHYGGAKDGPIKLTEGGKRRRFRKGQ